MTQFAKKLKAILAKAGKVSAADCDTLLTEAQAEQKPFTEVVVKKGICTQPELVALISKAANIPPIDLGKLRINPEVMDAVPQDVAQDYKIFPIDRIGNIITIAVANPAIRFSLSGIGNPGYSSNARARSAMLTARSAILCGSSSTLLKSVHSGLAIS